MAGISGRDASKVYMKVIVFTIIFLRETKNNQMHMQICYLKVPEESKENVSF